MRGLFITLLVLLVFGGLAFFALKGPYNNMVELDETVNGAWSQVEDQYQRRHDLIGNLVETVKGYAQTEERILVQVTEARAAAMAAMQSTGPDGGPDIAAIQQTQGRLSGAMRGFFGYTENYPELKSSQLFSDLQAQLEGTENRISTARSRFNDTVQSYNKLVRKFPNNLIAGMFGFEQREYFESTEGANTAPEVKF
ncbi:MAG: LemA family protein [Flavobacteriales bacterium]|nr:LemA family protein [Flavobacteriales bacterium]